MMINAGAIDWLQWVVMTGLFTATVFAFVMAGYAVAGTDLQCVNDCLTLKNPKKFCESQCTFKDKTRDPQPINLKPQTPVNLQVNPQCLNKCVGAGSPELFCQQLCSH